MNDLPDPLVPAEVDLRGYEFMGLYGDRLFSSETWIGASAEGKVAALRLWWHSYAHEVPAASLPDNDTLLADYAGYGVAIKAWLKVKVQALRGWLRCRDGRLYHPFVAELATSAWEARKAQRDRTERARKSRLLQTQSQNAKRSVTDSVTDPVTDSVTDSVTDNVTSPVTESKGKERKGSTPKPPSKKPDGGLGFAEFWDSYPRKAAKAAAQKAWLRLGPLNGEVDRIMLALQVAKGCEQWRRDNGQFIPHPATWINQRRWEDEPPEPERVMGRFVI